MFSLFNCTSTYECLPFRNDLFNGGGRLRPASSSNESESDPNLLFLWRFLFLFTTLASFSSSVCISDVDSKISSFFLAFSRSSGRQHDELNSIIYYTPLRGGGGPLYNSGHCR